MVNPGRTVLILLAASVTEIPLIAAQNQTTGDVQITLYDQGDFQGIPLVMTFTYNGECQNVPDNFNDRASSVDTHGNCYRLWDHWNCNPDGDYHRVRPDSPAHNNLGDPRVRFNDITSSVSLCQPWEW